MDQVAKLLGELARELKTTVPYLWAVMIKQASIAFWSMVIQDLLGIGVILAWVVVLKRMVPTIRKWHSDGYCSEDKMAVSIILLVVTGIVSFVFFFAIVFGFQDLMTAYLNPEYWALEQIGKMFKK